MTDLASLDIKVDSSQAGQASAALDKLTLAGQRVQTATERLAVAQAQASDRIRDAKADYDKGRISLEGYNQAVLETNNGLRAFEREHSASLKSLDRLSDQAKKASGGITGLGSSSQLASHHMLNLGYQINDVIVGLASGQKPMTVFIQQGAQIGQISAQSGVGLGGMAKAVGSLALNLAKAHPVMTALTIAAVGTGIAIKSFTDQLTKDAGIDKYVKSLGLTRSELKRLEDQHVTFGDVFKGVWKTINDATGISTIWSNITKEAGAAFSTVGKAVVSAGIAIVSAFEAAYDNVKQIWANLPEVLGIATVAAANAAIRGIQGLVNGAIGGLNEFAAKANELTHTNLFGKIGEVSLPQIKAQFSTAGQNAANAFSTDFNKRVAANTKALSGVVSTITGNIVDATKARLKKEAEDLVGDKKPKTDKHAEELAREAEAVEHQIANLYKLADAYGESGGAALIAEAREKAESDAIKKRGDIEEFVSRQIRLAIAQRVADAARSTAAMNQQAAIQEQVNAQVTAGLVPASKAAELVKGQIDDLPLLAALQAAQQKGLTTEVDKATKALNAQRDARERLNAASVAAQDNTLTADINKRVELTQREAEVTAQAGAARFKALRGLGGQPLQDALADINTQQEKSNILLRAQAEAADLVAKGMTNAAAATLAQADAAAKAVQDQADQQKAEDKISREKDQFLAIAQQFADIVGGGLGRAVSAVLPLLEKAKEAFASGNIASVLSAGASLGGAAGGIVGTGKGNSIGGQLGGAAGGAVGTLIGGPLGGMIGSVAGGILGSVVGGLFQGTKKASATIEVISGKATQTALSGNSGKLKAAASSMADSFIGGLSSIAEQLGGELSDNLRVSIGQRKKKYTVDLSGQGRTKGVPKFDTQEEAVAYAVQAVIQQGAITGLSAAEQTLLKGGSNLQAQLQKVLSFQGVFDELKQKTDPVGYAMDQIAKKFDGLKKIFDEAGASSDDYAKLAQLRAIEEKEAKAQAPDNTERDGLLRQLAEAQGDTAAIRKMELAALLPANRALQERIYKIQDEAAKTEKAAQIASQRQGLEIQLMEAQGKAAGALAAQRKAELATLDPVLQGLQKQVYAAQDLAAFQKNKSDLEIALMQAQGNEAGVLAAQRKAELAATDPLLRALLKQVYAAQDAAKANEALAQAQAKAADIAKQRASLEIDLLRATGKDAAATAKEREQALAGMDASLRDLQKRVWAAQDAQAAAAKAAQDAQARAQAAAQAAQERAAKAAAIANSQLDQQAQLMELVGDKAGALAIRRQMELAAMDATLRPMQQLIYAETDRANAIEAARSTLTDAYQRESDALTTTIDKFKGFSDSLRKFRDTLSGGSMDQSLASLRATFQSLSVRAASGDADAMAQLQDAGTKLLDASKQQAGTLQDYQRDVATVTGAVDKAIEAADEATDYAQAQLDALNKSVTGLIDINKSVVTVAQAIDDLRKALVPVGGTYPATATPKPVSVPTMPATSAPTPGTIATTGSGTVITVEDTALRQMLEPLLIAVKQDTGKLARLLDGVVDGDTIRVAEGE